MTREEAIQILADLIDSPFLHTWEKQNKALHMAIEALTEPSGDLISRADAIRAICGTESEVAREAPYDAEWFSRLAKRQAEIINIIDALPSAEMTLQTPQTHGKSINVTSAEVVNDLISRADAIEKVEHLKIKPEDPRYPDDVYNSGVETAKMVLTKIPSADAEDGVIYYVGKKYGE